MSEPERIAVSARSLVIRGVAWNTLYQVFQTFLSFGAMLVLVRLILPEEYGRLGTILGALTLMNAFNCGIFMTHALQLPDGVEPDWSAHWSVGVRLQLLLSLICHGVALAFWWMPTYRPVAPMMHIAAVGLMLDCPNQLGLVMLRRRMNFRRLRIITTCGTLANLSITIALALAGAGRFALVLNMNVLPGIPFAIDLLFIQRWSPEGGWLARPRWDTYRATLRFGLQQAGLALLHAGRGAAATAVLPRTLGYTAMGLLGRAQGFFQTTIGRIVGILVETVYPLMPRYAADPKTYPRHALLFLQVILWVAAPGAVFLGLEGAALSRLLYGAKWVAANPLIWPAAIGGLATVLGMGAATILLAANRLRVCFLLDALTAALTTPLVFLTMFRPDVETYAWVFAAALIASGLASFVVASRLLPRGWFFSAILPPAVAIGVGCASAVLAERMLGGAPALARLFAVGVAYCIGALLALRGLFARPLGEVLERLPGGRRLMHLLSLPSAAPVAP